MKQENSHRLFQAYPEIFNQALLKEGFECQDGWLDLLSDCAERIKSHLHKQGDTTYFEIRRVQQKMGDLRISLFGGDNYIRAIVRETECKSRSICELDGNPANGLYVCAPCWFRRLCQHCADLHGCMTINDYVWSSREEILGDNFIPLEFRWNTSESIIYS